jgi:hypothetical protein
VIIILEFEKSLIHTDHYKSVMADIAIKKNCLDEIVKEADELYEKIKWEGYYAKFYNS